MSKLSNIYMIRHISELESSYASLGREVMRRARSQIEIDDYLFIGDLVWCDRNGGLREPKFRLSRSKKSNDGFRYTLSHVVQHARFMIPFTVYEKKNTKEVVIKIKRICNQVFYDYCGTFYNCDY